MPCPVKNQNNMTQWACFSNFFHFLCTENIFKSQKMRNGKKNIEYFCKYKEKTYQNKGINGF